MKQYTVDAFTKKVEYITESRHPHLLSTIFAVSAACLVFAVMQGIHDNYGIMLPDIISRSGIDYASVSFVIAAGQILYGAAQPFFGMLAIRKSNAFIMLLGILLMAAGLIGTPFCNHLWSLLLCFGILLQRNIVKCVCKFYRENKQNQTISASALTRFQRNRKQPTIMLHLTSKKDVPQRGFSFIAVHPYMYTINYSCFLLKSLIAIINPKIDMATESKAGIIKSNGTTSPESKSTFFDVKMNGLHLAIGSIIPSKDIHAILPQIYA